VKLTCSWLAAALLACMLSQAPALAQPEPMAEQVKAAIDAYERSRMNLVEACSRGAARWD
jgi:hypothetical protein